MTDACPRCNSDQRFHRRLRDVGDGVSQAYISCDMCRWEKVIGLTTAQIERLRRKQTLARRRVYEETVNRGQPSRQSWARLERISRQLTDLESNLDKKAHAHR